MLEEGAGEAGSKEYADSNADKSLSEKGLHWTARTLKTLRGKPINWLLQQATARFSPWHNPGTER